MLWISEFPKLIPQRKLAMEFTLRKESWQNLPWERNRIVLSDPRGGSDNGGRVKGTLV